jgi:hypothetical protein
MNVVKKFSILSKLSVIDTSENSSAITRAYRRSEGFEDYKPN